MDHRPPTATLCLMLSVIANQAAQASCADDLTRIQVALAKAAPEIQSTVSALVSQARDKVKAKDPGCEAVTSLALQRLGLPRLAPIVLSTPVAPEPGKPSTSGKPAPTVTVHMPSAPPLTPSARTATVQSPSQTPGGNPATAQAAHVPNPRASVTPAPAAQVPAPPAPSAPAAGSGATRGRATEDHPFFIVTRDVIGKEVRASDDPGQTVGRLASLIIDEPSGVTQYAVIDRGGLLGWDRHHVIVPFHLLKFTGQWDLPTLTISTFKLEYAPYISDQDVEALLRDPEWRRSVADYFGVALAGGAPMTDQGSVSASSQAAPSTGSSAEVGQAAAGPTATHSSNTMISSGTESLSPAAAAQGQTIAQHLCGVCHTLNTGGGTRVGPNLYGVVGRPIASLSGYNYSSALKGHNGVWDMATLDNFLKDPRGYASGTYMTFPGIASERDRQAVITYLATLKTKAGALQ